MKRYLPALAASVLLIPSLAYPQITLTGATQFSTESSGAFGTAPGQTQWNTVPVNGDCCYGLWLALNPDGTSPVNGPSDSEAPIAIPLVLGHSYTYYTFGYPYESFSFNGLNLFFDGNDSTPGISVFAPLNSSIFSPDSSSTLTLHNTSVPGSGKSFYSADGAIVVLTGYNLHTPATPPGNVCQGYTFAPAPGDEADYFGSITLQVWPAAALSLSQASGSPETKITLTGSGYAPNERVEIFAGHIGVPPLFTATTTDATGSFSVAAAEPQHPYGPMDVYAVGVSSHKLGAATLSVTPDLLMNPATAAPGATATAYALGFGARETVDIYWNNPRQLLGTATANGDGSSALTAAIPTNALPGINAVIGVGQTTKAIGVGEVRVQ
jgi:hypothetical protein